VWAVSLGGSNADATARIHQAKTLVPTLFSTSTERVKASEVLTLVPQDGRYRLPMEPALVDMWRSTLLYGHYFRLCCFQNSKSMFGSIAIYFNAFWT
jgi:hypothetical protein